MAEKIVIGEIDLNIDKATKDAQSLKQTIELLKGELAKAKDVGGETSKEYIELSAALKQTQKEYNTQIGLIGKSVQADTAKAGSIEQLRAKLSVVSAQWANLSEDERKNTELGQKLTKQKLDLTNALKAEEKATGDTRRNVGNYTEGIKDATGALNQFIPGASQATSAATALGTAFKVMLGPIGLIIAAIAAVITYFKRSEEGQNSLAKSTAVFTTILNNFLDVVGKIGETIVNAFTKPKETLENFKTSIKEIGEFFKNTFGNVIGGSIDVFVGFLQKAFANVGLAWQKLKGIFVDNTEGINKAQEKINEYNQKIQDGQERVKEGAQNLKTSVVNAYNNARNAIAGFIEEQQKEIDIAKRLADQQAALDKQIRNNLILEAKDRSEIAKIRQQANDKENVSAQDRLSALKKAFELEEQILQRNLDIAEQKYEIKKAQNELSASTKQDLDEEAQLLANIYKLEQESFSSRVRLQSQLTSTEREIIAENKARVEETIKGLELELEAWRTSKETRALNDAEYNQQELDRQIELLNQKAQNELISEQEKDLLIQEYKLEYEEAERERLIEQAALDFENDMATLEGNLFAELDLKRQALEQERLIELEYANKIGADTYKVNQKYAKAQRALDQAEFNAKLTLAASFTKNLATIAGEQTAIGKAAAVASATISTIQGAINSYNSLSAIPVVGPVLGAVAAAAALVAGYAQVKEILSVKSGLPEPGVSASAPGGGGSAFSGVAASANVPRQTTSASVGQGIVSRDVDNQTSNAISSGVSQALSENPLQPTLVTDDVTLNQNENFSRNRTTSI